jgi:hypothetical protein
LKNNITSEYDYDDNNDTDNYYQKNSSVRDEKKNNRNNQKDIDDTFKGTSYKSNQSRLNLINSGTYLHDCHHNYYFHVLLYMNV